MDQNEATLEMEKQAEGPVSQIDSIRLKAVMDRLTSEQDLTMGILAGLGAAILGAVVWAAITVTTEYQIGYMSVGVGFLVGYAVRTFGKGFSNTFGIVGAACALLGCLLGNWLSICGFIANELSMSIVDIAYPMLSQPDVIIQILIDTFEGIDILFYAFALYWGYKYSFRTVSQEQIAEMAIYG